MFHRLFAPMIGLMLLAWSPLARAATVIDIRDPLPNAAIGRGRTVTVGVHITSELVLKSVTGRIGAAPAAIATNCVPDASGTSCRLELSTVGLANGTVAVEVSVTDGLDDTTRAVRPLLLDDAPTISGILPASLLSAPAITLTCLDSGVFGCASVRLGRLEADGTETILASSTVTTSFPTASLDGVGPDYQLFVAAVDTKGIETWVPLRLTIDRTPGLATLSRVPGKILDVSATYIVFAGRDGGVSIRDRRTGVDTLVSVSATSGQVLDEGALVFGPDGATSYWAGSTRRNLTLGAAGPRAGNGRRVVYGGTDFDSGDYHRCYVEDLATGTRTLAVDLATLAPVPGFCTGIGIAANGDLFFLSDGGGSALKDVVRVSGGVATPLGYLAFRKGLALLDPAGHVAFNTNVFGQASDLYYDNLKFGTGYLVAVRDGFTLFDGASGIGVGAMIRKPDGSIVDRAFFATVGAKRLGDGGELALEASAAERTTQYLVPLGGRPVEVAKGPGDLMPIAGGWLLAQADTLRCVRPPCGYANEASPEPLVDAGVPDTSVPARPGPVAASAGRSAAESGCSSSGEPGSSSLGFAAVVAALCLAGRRRRRAKRGE